ncbi:hypothetical protein K466DRAFT_568989, partial [Polyporus arcularius HHB13444]
MFQFPPNVVVLTFDGCPVVRVSDSPEDFRHLLRVLFPRPTAGNAKLPFSHVSAYVRLAHKYKMSAIREDGVKLLPSRDMGTLKGGAWHAIEATEIARLTGTEVILPLAFLDCASLGADLVRGYTREDGTHIHLSNEDLARTLKLSKYLRGQDLNAALDLGPYLAKCGAVDGCADPPNCRRTASIAWPMNVSRRRAGDPLHLRPWEEIALTLKQELEPPYIRLGLAGHPKLETFISARITNAETQLLFNYGGHHAAGGPQ